MSHAGTQTNGASLEDCHANFFSLVSPLAYFEGSVSLVLAEAFDVDISTRKWVHFGLDFVSSHSLIFDSTNVLAFVFRRMYAESDGSFTVRMTVLRAQPKFKTAMMPFCHRSPNV